MKAVKKWAALLAMLLCAALAAGCSLARPDEAPADPDTMVGALVRLQAEGWTDDGFFEDNEDAIADFLKEHASSLNGGAITLPDGLTNAHILTEEERGLCLLWEDETREDGLRSSGLFAGPVFSDGHTHVSMTDEGESVEISAVVCLDTEALGEEALLTVHPVYRRPDGALYAVPSTGMQGIFAGYSVTYEAKAETTDPEGRTSSRRFSVRVSFEEKPALGRAVLVEMGADNQPIAAREIDLTRDEPLEIVSDAAAWALVERYADGDAREEAPTREAINLDGGEGQTVLYLPSAQPGMLAPKTLTVRRAGARSSQGI